VPGDVHLQASSALIVNGQVEFTADSEILGDGTVYTSADESALVVKGTVDVGSLSPERGTMTFHTPVKAREVDGTGGLLVMENAASIDTTSLTLTDAAFSGSAHVTGDAWLENAGVAAPANLAATLAVDGMLSVAGDVTIERIGVTATNMTFEPAEPDSEETEAAPTAVYLFGSSAKIDISDVALSAIEASVETDLTNSFGAEFHAHVLDVTSGVLDLDTPTTIGPDDTVTVAENAVLKMSNVTQRGSFTVAGVLNLTGGATIESDIEATDTAQISIEEVSSPELVGGATIGGADAIVTNIGWIRGQGGLIGQVGNLGTIEPTPNIDVLGPFTQDEEAVLLIAIDGDQHGHLNVVGDSDLAGEIDLTLAAGGTLPTEPFAIVSASGSIATSVVSVNGLDLCSTMRFDLQAVTVVPQPCVAVASGSADEDAAQIDFTVSLSKPFAEPVVVHYGVVPGTADITDFVDPGPSSITVPAGATSATISIGLVDDDDEEQDETFTLTYAVEGGRAQSAEAIGTIVDDDVRIDYSFQNIPVPGGGISYLEGIGTDYVVGIYSADADTDLPWAYRISDGGFAGTQGGFMPSAVNGHDQAVGTCHGYSDPCMRAKLVDTFLNEPGGASGEPRAIADTGEIVGYLSRSTGSSYLYSPVRWADASSPAEEITGLGGAHDQALDVNNHGAIVGESRFGTEVRGWVRHPDGRVVEVGPVPGLPSMDIAGISDDGVVVGTVGDGQLWSQNYQGFVWTEADGITLLGPLSGVIDIAPSGDYVGYIEGSATLWRDGRAIDLNRALGIGHDTESDIHLEAGHLINDDGAIVVTGYGFTGVLIPPGAGCSVCLEGHLYEHQFPSGVLIDAGETIVEGNPTELFADVVNNDDEIRTVTVSFLGADGQPLGDPQTVVVAPGATEHAFDDWSTEGVAWKDGTDAGAVEVTIEMRDEGGNVIATDTFEPRVVPRPIVNVHGMNSDESTWDGYAAFASNAHFGWKAFAVDQMDTMPWQPNSIAQNAAITADYVDSIQRQENAWQVDLVAHSMGGLISRYYIQNLMVDHEGVRPVRRLVMLGTPNAGSPCADALSIPMTAELRTDVMRRFNEAVTDRRGVPFSIAAGDPLPATCHQIGDGDGVVSLESALTGMTDSGIFDVLHTDMTFSQRLFDEFVLPRVNGVLPASDVAAEPQGVSGFAATAATAPEALGAAAASPAAPQLLTTERMSLAGGSVWGTSVQVPADLSAVGVTAVADGTVEVQLLNGGVVVATSGTSDRDELFRSVGAADPAPGPWTIRVINHGTTTVDVPLSMWVQGAANTLVADVAQVGISKAVAVTARIDGPTLPQQPLMSAATTDVDGQLVTSDLYDDATHGDAVAADGTFTGQFSDLATGPIVVEVYANSVSFSRTTTAGTLVTIGTDGPGNDAPVVASADVTVAGGQLNRIVLQAADPEGDALLYEIVAQPAHGQVGGFLPNADYLPAPGYIGSDSFTFRVFDGQKYSAPATVTITVGRMNVEMLFREPMPPEPTAGSAMHVVLRVEGPRDESVDGGDVTITFDGRTITAPVTGGRVDADVPVDLPDVQRQQRLRPGHDHPGDPGARRRGPDARSGTGDRRGRLPGEVLGPRRRQRRRHRDV
jgi:pimeloyl-ACP methyl ester carboxylesterase